MEDLLSRYVLRIILIIGTIVVLLVIGKIMQYYLSKKPQIKSYKELIAFRAVNTKADDEYLENLSGYRRGRRMEYYNEEFEKEFFSKKQKQDPLLQFYGNIPQLMADITITDKIISDIVEIKILLNNLTNFSYSFVIGIENFDGRSITIINNVKKTKLEIIKDNKDTKIKQIQEKDYSFDISREVEQYFSLT